MKRIIVSAGPHSHDDDDYAVKYTTAINHVYAHLHNIPFEYNKINNTLIEDRHISWARIPILQKYVNDYDEVLWINPEVILNNRDVNVFDHLKTALESEWKRDNSITPIAYSVADIPTNLKHACTSVLLLDCRDKERAKKFLNDWWNDLADPRFAKNAPFEQSVWNDVWTKDIKKASAMRVASLVTMSEVPKQSFFYILPHYGAVQINIAKRHFYKLLNGKNKCMKKIGIYMRQQNFFTNGAGQNCIFLKHALEATGHFVDLLVPKLEAGSPTFLTSDIWYRFQELGSVKLSDYCLIVFGSSVPSEADILKMKTNGVRTVVYTAANILDQFHTEAFLGKSSTELPLLESTFYKCADECWIPDTHAQPTQDYLRILNQNKIPIKTIPHLWSPLFTQKANVLPLYKARNGKKVDIVILEPNLSYTKCGWTPLMVAEDFYQRKSDLVNKVYFFNTPESTTGQTMTTGLKLATDKKIKYMSRMPINDILAFFANPLKNEGNHVVFLFHQQNVPFNYAYYDVLSAGFPCVHNSKPLADKGVGFYYEDFPSGVEAILKGMNTYDLSGCLTKSRNYLATHDPYNDDVITIIKDRLICDKPIALSYPDLETPLCITYDNAPTETTAFFLKTLNQHKWDVELVGIGEKWEGWRTRLACYKKLLLGLPAKKIVVLSDARDVFCLRNAWSFKKAFESYKKPIVASMEIFCEGLDYWRKDVDHTQCMTLSSYWAHHKLTPPMRKFVNNGLVAGYAGALLDMVTWILDNGYTDDQYGIGNYVITFPENVAADSEARLLHTSTFGVNAGIQYSAKQSSDSPNLAELMGQGAYFLHVSGCSGKGQEKIYKLVQSFLETGLGNTQLWKLYGFDEPEFNHKVETVTIPFKMKSGEMKNECVPVNEPTAIETKVNKKSNYQFILITASKQRENEFLLQHKLYFPTVPLKIIYPEDDVSYPPADASKHNKRIMYCTRSHFRGIALASETTDVEYSILFEDDACFHKTDFKIAIDEFIDRWDELMEGEKMASLGWVPLQNYKHYKYTNTPLSLKTLDSKILSDRFTVGTQAYMVKNKDMKHFATLLLHNTYTKYEETILKGKYPNITKPEELIACDIVLPRLMGQRTLFPPVVIESRVPSLLNVGTVKETHPPSHWENYFKGFESLLDGYFNDDLKTRLQMITITVNEGRRAYMNRMLKDLNIGFDHEFYEGFTPANSKEYMNFKTEEVPESDNLLCCSRSHAGAIHNFVTNPKYAHKDIVLILEDDVTFVKTGFERELMEVVKLMEKHEDEIDFVNIGYLFKKPDSTRSDGILHWGMKGRNGALWGAQAYLIKREKAKEIASVIHKPTSKELYEGIKEQIQNVNKGEWFTPKKIQLTPDSFLTIAWRQGYINPMLAMEVQSFNSTIHDGYPPNWTRERKGVPSWIRPIEEFYTPPSDKPPSTQNQPSTSINPPTLQIIE